MLHVSYAISTYKNLTRRKNKEDAFSRTEFRSCKKGLTSFRDRQQSKCHLAAL